MGHLCVCVCAVHFDHMRICFAAQIKVTSKIQQKSNRYMEISTFSANLLPFYLFVFFSLFNLIMLNSVRSIIIRTHGCKCILRISCYLFHFFAVVCECCVLRAYWTNWCIIAFQRNKPIRDVEAKTNERINKYPFGHIEILAPPMEQETENSLCVHLIVSCLFLQLLFA